MLPFDRIVAGKKSLFKNFDVTMVISVIRLLTPYFLYMDYTQFFRNYSAYLELYTAQIPDTYCHRKTIIKLIAKL